MWCKACRNLKFVEMKQRHRQQWHSNLKVLQSLAEQGCEFCKAVLENLQSISHAARYDPAGSSVRSYYNASSAHAFSEVQDGIDQGVAVFYIEGSRRPRELLIHWAYLDVFADYGEQIHYD